MSGRFANKQTEETCGKSRSAIRISGPLVACARALWPVKTAAHLSEITGFSQRAAEAWLAGDAKIPSDALGALIRSDFGLDFIVAILGASRPRWRGWFEHVGLVGSQAKQLARTRQALERAIKAEHEATSTMVRAAAALCVQDEDFGGVFADGVRAMAGAPDRAVATQKRR